jgi:hypothetical protein
LRVRSWLEGLQPEIFERARAGRLIGQRGDAMKRSGGATWHRSAYAAVATLAVGLTLGWVMAASAALACEGDCNGDNSVDVTEIITLVNLALGLTGSCPNGGIPAGGVDVTFIIKAVNNALGVCTPSATPTPGTAICGNGVVDSGEDCDNGGVCIGGSNAGTACTADSQCQGLGVCIQGSKAETQCSSNTDCPGGTCEHCVPQGGDGCSANCSAEHDVQFNLIPGVVLGNGIQPGTSGAVVGGDILTIPLALTGSQVFTVGTQKNGQIPLIVKAASVQFPQIAVSTLACACVRGAPAKTCGGTIFLADGTLAGNCTDGFPGAVASCPADLPCTFVHGAGNSATGIVDCAAGGVGFDVSITQDSMGSSGSCSGGMAGPPVLTLSGTNAPAGSTIVINSTAIGVQIGTCTPTFCTDADDISVRGTPSTLPFTTGTATGEVFNVNCEDGINIGPTSISGAQFSCDALTGGSAAGGTVVGAFTSIDSPTVGDIVVTDSFNAQ